MNKQFHWCWNILFKKKLELSSISDTFNKWYYYNIKVLWIIIKWINIIGKLIFKFFFYIWLRHWLGYQTFGIKMILIHLALKKQLLKIKFFFSTTEILGIKRLTAYFIIRMYIKTETTSKTGVRHRKKGK